MRLFSYVVTHDRGLAPNPFHGVCTLACCKPRIRDTAQVGDWVFGLTRKAHGSRLVYAMRVTDKLRFEDYWHDPRFGMKRPNMRSTSKERRRGDNMYRPLIKHPTRVDDFKQQDSLHKEKDIPIDLSSRFVLVSDEFRYFGSRSQCLPAELGYLVVGRGHRCNFSDEQVAAAVSFIQGIQCGVHGLPSMGWSDNDMESCCRWAK